MLEIEKLYSDLKYTVQIIAPGLGSYLFLYSGQFTFSGSAEFTTMFQSSRINQIKQIGIQAQQIASELGVKGASQLGVIETVNQTLAIFTGYSKPTITVQVLDYAYSKDHNPVTRLKQLLRAVYPEIVNEVTISKPFNYQPDLKNPKSAKGLVGVRVSTFFEAHSFFVIRNVNLSFSQEISKYGFPIYGTAEITFEPYKLPSFSEVQSWFKF